MTKTCVFITGTNAVGKSSLAWEIINRNGGIAKTENFVTYCNSGKVCLAGPYGQTKYGGVDRITNEKGSSCTSKLPEVVEEGLKNCDVIICEGSFMNTFGMNMTNAMFKAKQYLVVNLWTDFATLYSRLTARSNGKNGKRNYKMIVSKQKQAMISAKKWQSIGVKVLQLNSSEYSLSEEADMIFKAIK